MIIAYRRKTKLKYSNFTNIVKKFNKDVVIRKFDNIKEARQFLQEASDKNNANVYIAYTEKDEQL